MPNHTVQQGECISSIAFNAGLLPETIWEDGQNSDLKTLRKDPNVLQPGDVLFVPVPDVEKFGRGANSRHTFVRKAVPAKLKLQLLRNGKPRANLSYTLIIDTLILKGTTNGQGMLVQPIMPNAKSGKLLLGGNGETLLLNLGCLDPGDSVSGVQARLSNLGIYLGDITGNLDPATQAAIQAFQEAKGLEMSGNPDQPTQDALKALFKS